MRRWIALGTTLIVLLTAAGASAASLQEVLDNPDRDEIQPSYADGYLVWTDLRRRGAHSFVKADGGTRVRLNDAGTDSAAAVIDGTTVAFQEFGPDGQIRFYDVVSETNTPTPDGINTRAWEDDPALSGDWLMFLRTNIDLVGPQDAYMRVYLVNTDTAERRKLLDVPYRRYYVATDQVNGDWATFETCRTPGRSFTDCQVFLYRISTETLTEVANPGLQQYAGAVTSDGTVYLMRTGTSDEWRCGQNAQVVRMPVGGPAEVIHEFPDGQDALTTFAFEEGGGSVTLYLSRERCERGAEGIYRITNADGATP